MSPHTASRRSTLAFGRALVLFLALAAAPATAAPVAESPQALLSHMEAAQRDLHTLVADFVQTSRVKLFKQEVRSEGRLFYERPEKSDKLARLRWEYLRPDPSVLVLIGDRATLRMGSGPNPQVQVFDTGRDPNMRAIFTQLRLWLGLGPATSDADKNGDANREYEMRSSGDPAHKEPALVLVPRNESDSVLGKTFARIELYLDGRTWQLTRLLLVERSGDEKQIVFTRVKRNVALPQGTFDQGLQ